MTNLELFLSKIQITPERKRLSLEKKVRKNVEHFQGTNQTTLQRRSVKLINEYEQIPNILRLQKKEMQTEPGYNW